MPRNVRNFWIELDVDGRKTLIACGPVARDGGFRLRVFMRDKGSIVRAMDVEGSAPDDGDGELILTASEGIDVDAGSSALVVVTRRDAPKGGR